MKSSLIQVLIIDHSPSCAAILKKIINSDPNLNVINCLLSGKEALSYIERTKPDVIVIDSDLPNMDGFETTHHIMQKTPIPIVMITESFQGEKIEKSFKAFQVGALEIISKPSNPHHPAFSSLASALIKSVKNAAIIQLTTRRYFNKHTAQAKKKEEVKNRILSASIKGIAIGASLGGPTALHTLFSQLPAKFPVPIFVVQHIATGCTPGLVEWIQKISPLNITLAKEGELPQPGYVYIAPSKFHLEITPQLRIHLNDDPPEDGLRPSVGRLFRSMAKAYGKHGMGIILTGMGRDGAADLLLMKQAGAVTIAQDQDSSLVFGMPKEAISLGAAQFVLSLLDIMAALKLFT